MQKLERLQYSSASTNTTPTTTLAYDPSSSSSPTTLLTPISNHPIGATAADSYPRAAFLADQISSSSAAAVNLPYACNDPIVTFDTWSSRNVVLNICGNEAFFNLCVPKHKSGVFTSVCYLFEKYNMEVLFANVSSNVFRSTYVIQAQVTYTYKHFYHMIYSDIYYLSWSFFLLLCDETGKSELRESVIGKWVWSRGHFQASCSRTGVIPFISINRIWLLPFEFQYFQGFFFFLQSPISLLMQKISLDFSL